MRFARNKNLDEGKIYAPANGQVVPIDQVPDKVFAEKILGDGIAVILESDTITAPATGKLSNVADTLHAYGIETTDGLELLVHIGINTVELKGQGFQCMVKEGQKVKRGDPLCKVDLAMLKEKGYPLHTPVLITNMDHIGVLKILAGSAAAKETCVMEYEQSTTAG